jgi:hypothetical protein
MRLLLFVTLNSFNKLVTVNTSSNYLHDCSLRKITPLVISRKSSEFENILGDIKNLTNLQKAIRFLVSLKKTSEWSQYFISVGFYYSLKLRPNRGIFLNSQSTSKNLWITAGLLQVFQWLHFFSFLSLGSESGNRD